MFLRFLFALLLCSCIFDSSDLIFGLKVPLFILVMIVSILQGKTINPSKGLTNYVCWFSLLLPILSFCIGYLTNMENYDNPNLIAAIKPYLFLFLVFTLQKDNQLMSDVIKILAYALLGLSIVILIIMALYINEIVPLAVLYEFGDQYVLFSVGERSFGTFSVDKVYFHSSPMLVFSICYFINKYIIEKKKLYLLFSFIISAALLSSGTRNNMLMGIIPYFALFYVHGSNKAKRYIRILAIVVAFYALSQEFVKSLLDKSETSNDIKLGQLQDYAKPFSNIRTILLGDGLDSYFVTRHRGRVNLTELTYIELFRRFGIFMGLTYIFMMFKPAIKLIKRPNFEWLGTAYALYLFMIMSNPFFFSSNGMAILSIVLAVYFSKKCYI